ncbi:16S rRNA (cytidine(1402)-2'-O)-methyltransferase [Halalkalibacter oceani]|uniref:16S rRNA (cytidine(1402)-2'-O)-methyltransferase n=1 Tax=Halalkalibacter oceani TaxID=1653776 RepID=UPI003393BD48
MQQQNSFAERNEGGLYLVPTPIGNLEDMTYRAVRTLREADLIAAEDTRQTIKLLRHYEIENTLVSYHEHNKHKAGESLIRQMQEGKWIALVSDAGMPAISDPGEELVQQAIAAELPVVALPGANAALTSLVASGLPATRFQFIGFLPRQNKQRQAVLEQVKQHESTLLFYEAPHRIKETLNALLAVLGNRRIVICRELTKKFEEYQRGTIEEAVHWCEEGTIKGEFCLVVEGTDGQAEADAWWEKLSIVQHVQHYIGLDMNQKEAIKQTAKDRALPKREVYAAFHQLD